MRPLIGRLAVLVPVAVLAVALGFAPVAANPLAANPFAANPLAANPFAANPFAGNPVPYPEPTVTPGVEGRITGTLTGPDGPVAGAHISASSSTAPSGSGLTSADGTFTIDHLAPAEYVLRFDAPAGSGLVTEYYADASSRPAATPVRVELGGTTVVDAELARSARLSGRVTDPAGDPVEGVRVSAFTGASESSGYADTAADGTWTISENLPPGTYTVSFTTWGERYMPSYYPGVPDGAQASPIDLAPGQQVDGLDVTLLDAGTLRVVARDASGAPAVGVPVQLTLSDGSVLSSTGVTGDEGVVEVGPVPAGTGRVGFGMDGTDQPFVPQWFRAPHGTTTKAAQASDVTIAPGVTTEVGATLRTGATITGTVRRPDGTPVAAYLGAYNEDGSVFRTAMSAEDGTYTLRGLTPGRYGVYAYEGDTTAYYGTGTKPAEPNVRVTGTAQASGIDITIGTRFADVQPTAPFAADIEWIAARGIDEGTTTADGLAVFDAGGRVSREALAVVLYRAAGSPAVPTPTRSPFADVADGAPHLAEMVWASTHGLPARATGRTLSFLPTRWVTRAEGARAVRSSAGPPAPLTSGEPLRRGEMAYLVHQATGTD
ncbi:MSCRAMM family protein [Cellulomonas sp. URHB0016]